jgi:hypothetical protein
MANEELEILADVWVERHHVSILYSLTLCSLIVKPHGFVSTPVQGVPLIKKFVQHDGLCLQFGVSG